MTMSFWSMRKVWDHSCRLFVGFWVSLPPFHRYWQKLLFQTKEFITPSMTNSLNLRFVRILLAPRSLERCPGVSQVDGANVDDSCSNWGSWVSGTLLWWTARKPVQTSPQREMLNCSANKSACCPICLGYSLFSIQKSLKRPSRKKDVSTSTHEIHSQETPGESSSSNPEQ